MKTKCSGVELEVSLSLSSTKNFNKAACHNVIAKTQGSGVELVAIHIFINVFDLRLIYVKGVAFLASQRP